MVRENVSEVHRKLHRNVRLFWFLIHSGMAFPAVNDSRFKNDQNGNTGQQVKKRIPGKQSSFFDHF